MPRESAWDIINVLGDLGTVEIIDHDPAVPQVNRPFANYVKRYVSPTKP
jgi:V-type H+-transporting ATPase subunit a